MPRGKKESNRPSAGGVVRNDYRKRNRKRHISMHCHSHGFQTGIRQGVRIVKRDVLESLLLKDINAREDAVFHLRDGPITYTEEDNDGIVGDSTQSSLRLSRLLFLPPFLKRDEIRRRRFSGELTMNDRWWEWEDEQGKRTKDPEPRFRWSN